MSEKFFTQPSVMTAQQHFSQVPAATIQRSRFDCALLDKRFS